MKHFAANNTETRRMHINSAMDDRTLHEIYLTPFEIAVKKARPWTVMACYNRVQGQYGTQSPKLLKSILREQWQSDAVVISDWDAVIDRVEALKAGLHLQMPGGKSPYGLRQIKEAIKKEALNESDLDNIVREILILVLKSKFREQPAKALAVESHHRLAREIGAQCITLLKNDNDLLPLKSEDFFNKTQKKLKIALIGEFAKNPRYQGNGSSEVRPSRVDNLWDIVNSEFSQYADFTYARGYSLDEGDTQLDNKELHYALELSKECDYTLILAGLPLSYESEGIDRKHLNLPNSHDRLITEVSKVQKNTIVVLSNGSAVLMPWLDKIQSVVETWVLGQSGAGAIADILFGKVNPSGKLAESFPARLEDNPSYLNFPGEEGECLYGERIFVGYRHYDTKKIDPLFPFGHGLSYTKFDYDRLIVSKDKISGDETLKLKINVSNNDDCQGDEIVQLYVHDPHSSLIRPEQELKGFKKVNLLPGETKELEFELNKRDLSYYDSLRKMWVAESGLYEIRIGSSSRDIRVTKTIQ